MALRKEFLRDVLDLSREERAELALRVLESLAPPDNRTDNEWIAEVESRARRAIAGSSARDFDDVAAEIDADLQQ